MSSYPSFAHTRTIDDLLVSILVYNYNSDYLEACLKIIFAQTELKNFEVLICDDATSDGSWTIANKYAKLYDGRITVTRNNITVGKEVNRQKSRQMCRGKYSVELTDSSAFLPGYVKKSIEDMEADPYLQHLYISRIKLRSNFLPLRNKYEREIKTQASSAPLVSICVYNFNYGRYLKQCLSSVFLQTYPKIEICFSDNASSDDSWEIALDFADRYPGRMSLTRNRNNFGPQSNQGNTIHDAGGKYVLFLCSDDAIEPGFIERCVTLLEKFPEATFAMVHRHIMDENGTVTPEQPFYDTTCLIPGHEQAAVYMMTSVNPSISQVMYRREQFYDETNFVGTFNTRWFGARILDFNLCCDHPLIYINEPLLLNRVHSMSEGALLADNLLQCIAEYSLVHQFADKAQSRGHHRAAGRLSEAIEKIGKLCIRYGVRFLLNDNEATARQYLHLAAAIFPGVVNEDTYQQLLSCWNTPCTDTRSAIISRIRSEANLVKRNVSYPPPEGSIPC